MMTLPQRYLFLIKTTGVVVNRRCGASSWTVALRGRRCGR